MVMIGNTVPPLEALTLAVPAPGTPEPKTSLKSPQRRLVSPAARFAQEALLHHRNGHSYFLFNLPTNLHYTFLNLDYFTCIAVLWDRLRYTFELSDFFFFFFTI